ncbi:hypothetical protein RchiOBHm_Chr5g0042631 [Rosa chinensis]|uniref:Uncharacterized protein n=1 Tax=Rosa chinensis TaxID=74649 RepID=A0A2P6QD50_ROSCH|nr:uncharacterized protein LOC112167063 isoform X1 [Rosa chinensis]PRQ32102.1 hypothetical protein RchiOBHm_Chr5g0042631 [Rosa chinensis]
MEASISSFTLIRTPTKSNSSTAIFPSINITKPYDSCSITRTKCHNLAFAINTTPTLRGRKAWKTAAIEDVSGAITDPGPVVLTWQIVVGAIAGVTPFVVAGIEFSKRIIAQQRCEVCGGSGLVLTKENYMKCPGCGGFLPWQSWKRFFTG